MKILVTGGAGMVGSHVAERFAGKGCQVIVYDNLMRSAIFGSDTKSVEYNWNYLRTKKNVVRVKDDIRDRAALGRCFKKYKPDAVVHAAGQPGVGFSLNDPLEDFSINAAGTINVLEALRDVNPKGVLVYCSTNKVYGDNVNQYPIAEAKTRYRFKSGKGVSEVCSVDMCGHTPYGVSKLTGDLYAQDYAKTLGIRTGVFRMSCIYGTRQFGFEDQGWIAWFAIRFLQGKPITVYGDGKQVRDVLWVGDLVNAFEKFMTGKCPSNVFNMGGGPANTLSLLELIGILQDLTGRHVKVRFDAWRKFDQKVYVSDIAKACQALEWRPRVAAKEGIMRVVEWLMANKRILQHADQG
ncbi:MAG: NAD-dependent epimerase/dehydratase family protein [Candidatus Omnitrophica bacterium]|nr:NAD-dependent epimerase/dehydratase family protein [Candidatus Omnitrophota bacterium]